MSNPPDGSSYVLLTSEELCSSILQIPITGESESRLAQRLGFFKKRKLSEKEFFELKPSAAAAVRLRLFAFFYRNAPLPFKEFSLATALLWVLRISIVCGIAAIPVIFAKYISPTAPSTAGGSSKIPTHVYYQAAILAALQAGRYILDFFDKRKKVAKERQKALLDLSVALSMTIGVIERQVISLAKAKGATAERNAFLSHALKCIEATVHLCTDEHADGYCGVTLLTFEDNGKAKIRARSKVGRPIGQSFPQTEILSYWAARYARQSGVIHHFRKIGGKVEGKAFRHKALSINENPPYESILLFPLPAVPIPGQNQARKGVVTIDSARPYEFLGKDADILNRVQAYLDVINLMLTHHNVGIRPEAQP